MSPALRAGALLVDKPPGPTSHDVVAQARIALDLKRIGHTGTLDPFASGLLILCLGTSTRIAQYLSDMDKTYEATARLGVSTTTDDLEGEIVKEDPEWRGLDEPAIREALRDLEERIEQVPPQYSAKKVGGEPMYRKARRGESVPLDPAPVTVHQIGLERLQLPYVSFEVRCSSGTYVRALARDLGEALGAGAHLTELRRTAVGGLRVEGAIQLDALKPGAELGAAHLSPARALAHLPTVRVTPEEAARLAQGQAVTPEHGAVPEADPIAVLQGDRLVAVAYGAGDALRPRKVLG